MHPNMYVNFCRHRKKGKIEKGRCPTLMFLYPRCMSKYVNIIDNLNLILYACRINKNIYIYKLPILI